MRNTRARKGLLILDNSRIREGNLVGAWKDEEDPTGRGVKVAGSLPHLGKITNVWSRLRLAYDKYVVNVVRKREIRTIGALV